MDEPVQGIFGHNTLFAVQDHLGVQRFTGIRVDAAGNLQVVIPPGVPLGVDVQQYAGAAVASAGLAGAFAVGGTSAPNAAFNSNPIGVSALASTDAAMPAAVAAGTGVRVAADLQGRLHTNLGTIRGTAAVQAGVNGLLAVGGDVAPDAVYAGYPFGTSGLAHTDAAMPVALTAGRAIRHTLDLQGRTHINVGTVRGTDAVQAGVNGMLAVGGDVAPDVAFASNPLGAAALANTDAAMPVALTAGRCVRIAADLQGRLHMNLGTIRGTAAVEGGVSGLLGVGGSEGDDVAAAANPVVMGGIYLEPQTALTATGRAGRLLLDPYRRLRVGGSVPHDAVWATTSPSPVAVGGYADVSYGAAAVVDGRMVRFVANGKGWQRMEVFGPTADAATPAVAANYPLPVSGLYKATPAADLADGQQGTVLLDARRSQCIVGGDALDDSAQAGTRPVKLGAVAATDPTASVVANADMASLVTDLNRFLRVVSRAYDTGSQADKAAEVAPLNMVVDEFSLVDTANLGATAGTPYPSADGIVMLGFKDISFTGKFICGAADTVALTIQGTNDEDATPANRDWITVYAWRSDTNAVVNSVTDPISTTTTFGWDADEWNYKYCRINIVVTGGVSNTIIVKGRRKAL